MLRRCSIGQGERSSRVTVLDVAPDFGDVPLDAFHSRDEAAYHRLKAFRHGRCGEFR